MDTLVHGRANDDGHRSSDGNNMSETPAQPFSVHEPGSTNAESDAIQRLLLAVKILAKGNIESSIIELETERDTDPPDSITVKQFEPWDKLDGDMQDKLLSLAADVVTAVNSKTSRTEALKSTQIELDSLMKDIKAREQTGTLGTRTLPPSHSSNEAE